MNASWVLRYVSPVNHKTRECGLGSVHQVTLAEARQKAAEARVLVSRGQDPIAARAIVRVSEKPALSDRITFGQAAVAFWEGNQERWRNAHVRGKWVSFMQRHCQKIWQLPVDQIDQQLMLMVIQPIWTAKNVSARRCLHRCGQVIDYARFMKWRSGANPARFKGELEFALPRRPANVNVKHLAAVLLDQLPALIERLTTVAGTAALAARFCILTASRPGEAFRARWDEI